MRLFMFRLCLLLGRSHPDELLAELNAHQIAEWMAYATLEPFDHARQELGTAYGAANICAAITGKPQRVGDFMPKWSRGRKAKQDQGTMFKIFSSAAKAVRKARSRGKHR